MKKIILTLGLTLYTLCTLTAKDRVIERPPFITWSTNNLEVEKMVISDTATVVYIKAFYTPKKWIKVARGTVLKDKNEQIYPIRNGIGITLDKEFWIPESGEAEFQLIFPPLPENITSIDFSEGDFKGAFKIWGIQLNEKAFNKTSASEIMKAPRADIKMTLPEPINKYAKAILKGKVLDYTKGMPTNLKLYYNDVVRGMMSEESIQIREDGTFYKEIDAFTVTPSDIMLSQTVMFSCLLAPGETTSITINIRELTRQQSQLRSSDKSYGKAVYYNNYLAGLQQELSENKVPFRFFGEDYKQGMIAINGKTPEEYKDYILNKLPKFKKQIAQLKCSPACKEILKMRLELSAVNFILETERNLKSAHIIVNNLKGSEATKYYSSTQLDIPENYYQCFKEFSSINSPKICYSDKLVEMARYMGLVKEAEEMLQKGLGTDKGYMFDCIKTFRISNSIKDFKPLDEEQKALLTSLPASYGEIIRKMNNNVLKQIEINKRKSGFTINEVGQVTNEELFPSIISKFKGHTLLVDFWATWCGPCRQANKLMVPMKEELKNKDIIYLYITGETSPLGTWQNMITDIHGEHYRVTNEQWSYLISKFDIQGVPTYYIVDSNGNITFKETGFPGVAPIKEQIIKALNM